MYKQKFGISRNSSPLNQNKIKLKRAPELNQKTKDSLHGEANKYGKAFYSPKHKVNVDIEDGVLENRVFYEDGSELKYESIDKPFSKSGINRDSNEPRKTTKGKGRNFRTVEEGAGMTAKGVASYKAKNPGSKLKTAVTGDVKPGSKAAKRRKSFCARSKGWTGERGKAARRRWKC
jgi:hypothetical protein